MLKKIVLVVAAVSSFGVLADTTGQVDGEIHFDKESFCTYKNEFYSIGSLLEVGDNTLTCIIPGKTKSGNTNKDLTTAHWG